MSEAILDRASYRVLNDGPDRFAVVHDDFEECPIFENETAAWEWVDYIIGEPPRTGAPT